MKEYTKSEMNSLLDGQLIPKQYRDKVCMYSYNTYKSDEFIPPSSFFYTNAFDSKIFLLTRSEKKAQEMIDGIEGKQGKFKVRRVVKAIVC